MEIIYFTLCLVILAAAPAWCSECEAEEHSVHQLSCTDLIKAKTGLVWYAEKPGDNETILVARCIGPHNACETLMAEEFKITLNDTTSVLTINNVSRIHPFNMETRWYCSWYDGNDEVDVCPTFNVFVKPEKPVCEHPYLNISTYEISVTCSTGRVYPQAACQMDLGNEEMYIFDNQNVSSSSVINATIYHHTLTHENPDYYSTQCTLNIPLSYLADYGDHYRVRMNPNGLAQFAVSSDIQRIKLVLGNEDIRAATKVEDDDDDDVPLSVVIGLSSALGVAVVVVVVLGICLCRRKGKMEPTAPKLPKPTQKLPKKAEPKPQSYDNLEKKTQEQGETYEVPVQSGGTADSTASEQIELEEEDLYNNPDQEEDEIYEN